MKGNAADEKAPIPPMSILETIKNYCCYCGIGKQAYDEVKADAYVSNYKVWKVLHVLMAVIFGSLFLVSLFSAVMATNRVFYFVGLIYSVAAIISFHFLKQDSIAAQLVIYLSISFLFLFGCFITENKPDLPATTFVVLLLITPMFMIDKPYFMMIELCAASAVFLIWMYYVKPAEIFQHDLINVIIFLVVGIVIHVIANSIRIKEFTLTRQISIQKDTDELTGLKNKSALTREINEFMEEGSTDKGIMFLLDVDDFKDINDTYGHDVGDVVIARLGTFLGSKFTEDDIVGRWGGDEFIIFIKGNDDPKVAKQIADDLTEQAHVEVSIPNSGEGIHISVGAAIYDGVEKNYSDMFKKADSEMYKVKAQKHVRY